MTVIFLLFGFGFAIANPPQQAVDGRQRAAERIRENMNRIEKMAEETGAEVNLDGLRRAMENHLEELEDDFCHQFDKNLEYGDEDEDVKNLQRALEIEGYFEGEKNGVYGWDSARALYDFQKEKGIELEGEARFGFTLKEKTRDRLNEIFDCEDSKERVELSLMAMDGGTTDPKPETHKYEEGEEITVEAIPDEGYEFNGWEREGSATECDRWEKECVFEIKEESILSAHFEVEEDVVYSCDEDADCRWVSTNCCPENAGANWECVNEEDTELNCDDDIVCPQVVSPQPSADCVCVDGSCEIEE